MKISNECPMVGGQCLYPRHQVVRCPYQWVCPVAQRRKNEPWEMVDQGLLIRAARVQGGVQLPLE